MPRGQSKVSHFILLAWAHLLSLFLMPFHRCAQTQSGISSMPPYGFSLRENLSASFTVIVIAFLSAFVFVDFFTLCVHHFIHSNDAAGIPLNASARIRRRCVNREITNDCPNLLYSTVKDLKIGGGALECAVCLGEFQDSDALRLLPKCHHVFHPDCIDAWLASHVTCPICRARVLFDCGESAIVVPIETNTNAPSNLPPGNPTTTVSASTSSGTEPQLVVPNAKEDVENDSADSQVVPETNNVYETAVCQELSPPTEVRILDKLTRSHSTGHFLVEMEEEKIERGILKLPENVRNEILENHSRINQPWESSVVLAGVWCSKKGFCKNDGEGNSQSDVERWRLSMTPPLVRRGWGSVRMPLDQSEAAATSSQRLPI